MDSVPSAGACPNCRRFVLDLASNTEESQHLLMRLKIENEERRRRRRTIKSARVSQILVGGQVKCMPIDLNRAQGPNGPADILTSS
jgi:hypothetical protein